MLLPPTRSEDLPGMRTLGCYIVKTPYVPEVIATELKNNQLKKGTLRLKPSYCCPTHNE